MSELFVTHKSNGVQVWSLGKPNTLVATLSEESNVFDVEASSCGKYLAVLLVESLQIYSVPHFDAPLYEMCIKEPLKVIFSPLSTHLAVNCASRGGDAKNLKVYELSTGNLCYENVDKQKTMICWLPDESLAYRIVGSEILFFEKNNFSHCIKKFSQKFVSCSMGTNKSGCILLAVFVRGQKAAPSMVKVYAYPQFENIIASQSLYKADEVNMKWNYKSDALLAQTYKEVDTTGKCYYGETSLFFMDLKGTACNIVGKKDGSVHSSEWVPKSDCFITISGRMPASMTLYNNRAEPIYQFGEASVNAIYFNPFGNLVAFTGFSNLCGDVHVWNLQTRALVSHFQTANTTYFSWFPDGLHMLGATVYARLKVDNGLKTFDYLGNQLCHEPCPEKVHLLKTMPIPNADFQEPVISATAKGKVLKDQPVHKYIPPHMRTKQDEARIKKMLSSTPHELKDKQIKSLNKKLDQIKKLKAQLAQGKELELNQLDKVSKEAEIIKQLEAIEIDSFSSMRIV